MEGIKANTGGIQNLEQLLKPENLSKLKEYHEGIFCFLAFHPVVDKVIVEYVDSGSLASDSGRQIMVLFIANSEIRVPKNIHKTDLDFCIQIEPSLHPAYEAVELLFPNKKVDFPGIIFFDDFVNPVDSVYVSLIGMKSVDDIVSICRTIFTLAHNCYNESKNKNENFIENFSIKLTRKQIYFERTRNKSNREWLIRIYQKIYENKGDIITVMTSLL